MFKAALPKGSNDWYAAICVAFESEAVPDPNRAGMQKAGVKWLHASGNFYLSSDETICSVLACFETKIRKISRVKRNIADNHRSTDSLSTCPFPARGTDHHVDPIGAQGAPPSHGGARNRAPPTDYQGGALGKHR